jgi:hypothetical protein
VIALTAFVLKIIVSVCMLLDHIYAALPVNAPIVFNWIGRIAFPIYAYMIAQGCKHTKNINKYLLRLGVFALISEIPFDMAFHQRYIDVVTGEPEPINFLSGTNVFFTLFLGAACIALYEKLKTKKRPWLVFLPLPVLAAAAFAALFSESSGNWQRVSLTVILALYGVIAAIMSRFLPNIDDNARTRFSRVLVSLSAVFPLVFLASLIDSDYGWTGAVYILVFYLAKPENRITRSIAMLAVVAYEYAYPMLVITAREAFGVWLFMPGPLVSDIYFYLPFFLFALGAVALVFLYNGKRGGKAMWAFYVFYPAHIAALAAVSLVIAKP